MPAWGIARYIHADGDYINRIIHDELMLPMPDFAKPNIKPGGGMSPEQIEKWSAAWNTERLNVNWWLCKGFDRDKIISDYQRRIKNIGSD